MENRFTAMQKGLAMIGGHVGKKKPVKKPVPKEIKVPKNIFDARRVGMKFLSEAGFGAYPEVKFKNRILRSNDPVEIRGIIEEIIEAKKMKRDKK